MDKSVKKSLLRKLKKEWRLVPYSWKLNYLEQAFKVGHLAVALFPDWAESDYKHLEEYLFHGCGFSPRDSSRLATIALTYYEIPSLAVWKQVGWAGAAQAAQRDQDDRNQRLLDGGSNPLDLLTMI